MEGPPDADLARPRKPNLAQLAPGRQTGLGPEGNGKKEDMYEKGRE